MAGCKIEDIKEAMIKFIAPGKRTYEDLVKKGLIDNDMLTQYIRTGLKDKKADAINARFDEVLKGYKPEVESEESKQLVKDVEEAVKEIKAKDAKPETPQKEQNIVAEKTSGVFKLGKLEIPYKVEDANKNRPLATTNVKTGEISIQKGITALAMAEYLSKGNDGSVNHTIATRKTVLAKLKKEYGVDFNDVIKDLDADKTNQLVRQFLLLHEYRHTMQIAEDPKGFKEAYKADPVKYELDADLFALKALVELLPSVKPTKELKLDDTKLKAGEDLPNQELTEAQVKAIEARNEAYLKANPDVKVVESNTYWWDNSAIQVVEGDTRANRAVYLAHELYHDKTAEWLRQNQEDPDVKKFQRLMDMVRDQLRKDIYSNNNDTVELLNERLRWDSGQKELGLLQENTAILLAEPNVQKALEEYVGKDRRNIVQKVMDKLKEYMFKTSEDRVNYDEIMKMVKKIERKSTKLAPVSTETMLETASPMELIEMAEQKKKC